MPELKFKPVAQDHNASLKKPREKYSVASAHRQKGGTLVAHTTEKILSLPPLLGEQIADDLESETLDFQVCPTEAKLRERPKVEDCYE
ncbi:MAG: hypothetical protein HXX11_11425 [Desulfuromonadales bacterium]|nr:hypothetical protein [Desulfuromonadales bacterium]